MYHWAKKVQIYLQGDLMAIKKSKFALVGMRISANMTQVSDVAPGPLVIIRFADFKCKLPQVTTNRI
jgi:hypothetical protein